MTPQEIFDTVARHLFTQGERSIAASTDYYEDDVNCMYRSPSGMTCAVGCLIPDAAYLPSMEGSGATGLCRMFSDVLPKWMAENSELLDYLQMTHDQVAHWRRDVDMKFALSIVADRFGLDKSILDGLSFNRAEA